MLRISLLVCIIGLASCGQNVGSRSHVKDIATDLPDTGASPTIKEIYYIHGAKINRSRCPADATIFTRTICNGRTQRMDYTKFKSELNGGLIDLVISLTKESERIQTALDTIQAQIRVLQKEIDRIEQTQGGLSHELIALRAEVAKLDSWIEEGRTQIRNINENLRHAANQDLMEQRDYIVLELAKLQKRIILVNERLSDIVDQLATINCQVAALKTEMSKLSNRASNLSVELVDVQDRLARASSDLSVYNETIGYLENGGITYMVTSETDWFQKVRKFVKRFDEIMDRLAAI